MLDVHPPHHSPNTWRDFFLHIATICVGLLIAIALEQGVELLHHRHQRARLEEDIRAEAAQNIRIMDSNFATDLPLLAWQGSAMRALRDAPTIGGFVTVVLPSAPSLPATYTLSGSDQTTTPSHSVWTVAQSTGQVDLLPLDRAKVYDRLEREAVEYLHIDSIADVENTEFQAVLRGLNVNFASGEKLHLTSAQRDELVRAVNKHAQMQYWDDMRLAFWKGASEAVLHGVQKPDEVVRYMNREISAVQKP